MEGFANKDGAKIVMDMIKVIQDNKQYLSDIDGKIGDGDHGINMNKGFTICQKELDDNPGDFSHSLKVLSKVLMTKIGGSMGPLYGYFFKSMADVTDAKEIINGDMISEMLQKSIDSIQVISDAKVGDKTLLDTLVPAYDAFQKAINADNSVEIALGEMKNAARVGMESTKNLVAQKGRASRLGERSRGVLDPGACSCCLILESMANTILELCKLKT